MRAVIGQRNEREDEAAVDQKTTWCNVVLAAVHVHSILRRECSMRHAYQMRIYLYHKKAWLQISFIPMHGKRLTSLSKLNEDRPEKDLFCCAERSDRIAERREPVPPERRSVTDSEAAAFVRQASAREAKDGMAKAGDSEEIRSIGRL